MTPILRTAIDTLKSEGIPFEVVAQGALNGNQFNSLSAESQVDSFAKLTPQECAEYERWLDSRAEVEIECNESETMPDLD